MEAHQPRCANSGNPAGTLGRGVGPTENGGQCEADLFRSLAAGRTGGAEAELKSKWLGGLCLLQGRRFAAQSRCAPTRRAVSDAGSPRYHSHEQGSWFSHLPPLCGNHLQPENWESETRSETARALQPKHDGRCVYAYLRRRGSKRRARSRRGDLWRSVPSCSTFGNMEQERGSKLKSPCTQLDSQL